MSKALMGIFWGVFSIPKGLCMVIGGIRHQEQRFNSRSAGVSSALLFLSVGECCHCLAVLGFGIQMFQV